MNSDHVGARLRRWRLRRGLSQRVLAGLAGFSQGYIAQIENGSAPLDRLAAREALASALQISVRELTGRPDEEPSRALVSAAAMTELRSGIIALAVPAVNGGEGIDPPDAGVDTAVLDGYFVGCRYDLLVPALARTLTALASPPRDLDDTAGRRHQRRVVEVCSTTVATCVQLGHPDLTLVMAGEAMRTAEELGEPAHLGLANYARIRAVYATTGAARVAGEGIDRLSPYVGKDAAAASTYGMHHLISAEMAAQAGRASVASAHLAEAEAVAAHTGERPDDWFSFGPTNVVMWRLAILVALGEGRAARALTAGFRPEALPSPQRQATYFIDLARALLQGRGTEDSAAAALYRAETIAPQQVSASPGAREALRALLSRPRFGRDSRMRGLAGRCGIRD
ncbi:transcriptional regulator [Actinoplanes italicus]|uniref:Helix-turn-helix protein n=1 Tax=Actinoplanes italicus TaxID=113567 RepID=A0A2T0K8W2_9ACTN|nr:helix-turn-helix transcriptional regulator [Actinoplanes italicus]PRX19514.1 helix-turn-helix protein [Actinoplanes italicus]GIE30471.1 transcriptional regulator [Actinoplanes italicus]